MTKRVLITGMGGFIGVNIALKLIELNYEVHGILKDTTCDWRIKYIKERVCIHYVDLADKKGVDSVVNHVNPDIFYHLAVHNYLDCDLTKIIKTNVIGTINLLESALKNGFELFINTGSSSEYGQKDNPMNESDVLEPNSYYAITKATSTHFCSYIGKDKDLPIITLRLFSVYGPYEDANRFIPRLIINCLKDEDIKLVSSDIVRDFIHIDDVVNAYLKFIEHKSVSGEIFNVASGNQLTLGEVVDIVIKNTNTTAKPLWGSYPARPWDNAICWLGDVTKIKKTGWEPKYNLETGLIKTIQWFKKNLDLYNDND